MKFNTIVFLKVLSIAFGLFYARLDARSIEVFASNDLKTIKGGIISDYQTIEIPDIATYGQIRKAIAKAFNVDPDWRNFTIKYVNVKTGVFNFLKPKIEKLSRVQRSSFFNTLSEEGYGKPTLYISKRQSGEMKSGRTQETRNLELQIQQEPLEEGWTFIDTEEVPEITQDKTLMQEKAPIIEEENLGWGYIEENLPQSNPSLLQQIQASRQKIEERVRSKINTNLYSR